MGGQGRDVVRRRIDTDTSEPAVEVAKIVAELEGDDAIDVANMYDCVDHVLDNIFERPPSPEARMEIEFSYEGYRIAVRQDGTAEFVKTG